MHWHDADGHHFRDVQQTPCFPEILEVYTFEKENFEKHEFRHRISDEVALAEIEKTIFCPDRVTLGRMPKSKRNFYRVTSYKDGRRGERALTLWRVHAYKKENERRYFIIATAFEGISSVANAVHYLEKDVWRKRDSLI